MGIFKKKPAPVQEELTCPADGCKFITKDKADMDKHIAWKHPGIKTK